MATDSNENDGRFSDPYGSTGSSSSESESDEDSRPSGSEDDNSAWVYGETLTPEMFRNEYLPNGDTLKELFALTDDDTSMTSPHLKSNGMRAREILCRSQFQIRGRILESQANGGNGAERVCTRTGPYLARQLLVSLQILMSDYTKPTMTYAEVHTSKIGTTLTSFKAQMKKSKRMGDSSQSTYE